MVIHAQPEDPIVVDRLDGRADALLPAVEPERCDRYPVALLVAWLWELLTKVDTANSVRLLASLGRGRRIPSRQSSLQNHPRGIDVRIEVKTAA